MPMIDLCNHCQNPASITFKTASFAWWLSYYLLENLETRCRGSLLSLSLSLSVWPGNYKICSFFNVEVVFSHYCCTQLFAWNISWNKFFLVICGDDTQILERKRKKKIQFTILNIECKYANLCGLVSSISIPISFCIRK